MNYRTFNICFVFFWHTFCLGPTGSKIKRIHKIQNTSEKKSKSFANEFQSKSEERQETYQTDIGNKLSNFNKCIFTEDFVNKTFKRNQSKQDNVKAYLSESKNVPLTYRRANNMSIEPTDLNKNFEMFAIPNAYTSHGYTSSENAKQKHQNEQFSTHKIVEAQLLLTPEKLGANAWDDADAEHNFDSRSSSIHLIMKNMLN